MPIDDDVDHNDQPRLLTDDEIDYIASHIPLAPSADKFSAEVSRRAICDWVAAQCRGQLLAPSAIPDFINILIKYHTQSRVDIGTPVGLEAAEALGASTTQMTLNTFHTSGSSKSTSANIETLHSLIFARKEPHNQICTIYFTDKQLSYQDVFNKVQTIVGSVISDFVEDYIIDEPRNLPQYWWHDPKYHQKRISSSSKVARLYMNVPEMYKHRVSLAKIVSVLEREVPPSLAAVYGPNQDGIIDLYPDPEAIGGSMVNKIPGTTKELAEETYLESIVMPELDRIRVKGIAGITGLTPIVAPVWQIVLQERRVNDRDITLYNLADLNLPVERSWLIFCNPAKMLQTGLLIDNLRELCIHSGMNAWVINQHLLVTALPIDRFVDEDNNFLYVEGQHKYRLIPSTAVIEHERITYVEVDEKYKGNTLTINAKKYRLLPKEKSLFKDSLVYEIYEGKVTEMSPKSYVDMKVSKAKRQHKALVKEKTKQQVEAAQSLPEAERKALIRRPVVVEPPAILRRNEFVFAEADGQNMRDLMALPGIDTNRLMCNNMHVITETLGIESAFLFIIQSLLAIINSTGSYVNPAHIITIAEFVTSRGRPYGATYSGISRQPAGHLSMATVERAAQVILTHSLHGRSEDIRNVSAAIIMGARIAIGNGYCDIGQDITENGVKKTVVNDDLFTCLENDDATKAIMEAKPAQIISEEVVTGGLDALRELAGFTQIDTRKEEDDINLLNMMMPDQPGEDTIVREDIKGIKRVAPAPDIDEVVGYLAGIKRDNGLGPVTMQAPAPTAPVLSSGLVEPPTMTMSPNRMVAPELDELMTRFFGFAPVEAVGEPEIVRGLPITTPVQAARPAVDITGELANLRREQLGGLTPFQQ